MKKKWKKPELVKIIAEKNATEEVLAHCKGQYQGDTSGWNCIDPASGQCSGLGSS